MAFLRVIHSHQSEAIQPHMQRLRPWMSLQREPNWPITVAIWRIYFNFPFDTLPIRMAVPQRAVLVKSVW
ncbi:hypothetical protein CQ14_14465 [Bradyrhizobium lablabi]|uniref:Uncharacterized protein n=1 Tax=Bradyrhizobium lablabi TaxID=722472 RepID=A0A0R3MGC4_9BRAD|nr:hypothetical protein CQ14_14465 [Bradyrhizobium lablabi]